MLMLFATGLLKQRDLGDLDWSTLGLIAGGLALGRLLESTGLLATLSYSLDLSGAPRWIWLGSLVFASALLAALMSNTATAALLVPLGLLLDPSPATAVVIAVATSFGMPCPISTPPNAMVYGTGHVTVRDLLQIGLPLMIIGCLLVTLSGIWFLGLLGIR
jgi:sodium-dependent dicarboxylate transporter 2/3/5